MDNKTPIVSRQKQLYIDIAIVAGYLGFAVYLIWAYHNLQSQVAFTLFIGMSGITVGWLIGLLSTPFSGEEENKFSQFRTAIISFLTGYLLSKFEPVFDNLTAQQDLLSSDLVMRLMVFVCGGIVGFISLFVYRRYYLQGRDIEMLKNHGKNNANLGGGDGQASR